MTTLSVTSTTHPRPGASSYRRTRTATAVGVLFVIQMVSAMAGSSLIEAFVDGNSARGPMTVGVALMMVAGLAVVAIGLLMYPALKEVSPRLAGWYPALRIVEFTVSAACGVYLLIQSEVVADHMLWIYVPTGLGGILLTYLLLVSRLVPRAIAVLGLVGYGLLTIGVPLDLLGLLDMGAGGGLLLVVPGGLFELVVLPIWLIAKGLAAPHRRLVA